MIEEKSFYQQGYELAINEGHADVLEVTLDTLGEPDRQEYLSGYTDGKTAYIMNGIRDEINMLPLSPLRSMALLMMTNAWKEFRRTYGV